ncbi:MAG: HEAT repeat domain-containing protein [Abitibacteriaceae bacterium]|nr:HEAT repeat domain-containing protein [Abditibacteriaceae bacterium]
MSKPSSFLFLVVAALCWLGLGRKVLAQESQSAGPLGGVSPIYTVNGWKLHVSLVPDKNVVMLGEPIFMSYIVRNDTNQDLQMLEGGDYRNEVGRPDSFKIRTLDDQGQAVPQPVTRWEMGGLGGPEKIPARGQHVIRLFLPHWATFQKPGHYTIGCSRTLSISPYQAPEFRDKSHPLYSLRVQTTATINVVPANQQRMSQIIHRLGTNILSRNVNDTDAVAARLALASMHDERTIPFWVKAFRRSDYDSKFAALDALSRFNNAAAFAVLKQGMKVKGKEAGPCDTTANCQDSANLIHDAAAFALSVSPFPGAKEYLLQFADDPYWSVRFRVVDAAAKLHSPASRRILQKLAHDPHEMVRGAVQDYLRPGPRIK